MVAIASRCQGQRHRATKIPCHQKMPTPTITEEKAGQQTDRLQVPMCPSRKETSLETGGQFSSSCQIQFIFSLAPYQFFISILITVQLLYFSFFPHPFYRPMDLTDYCIKQLLNIHSVQRIFSKTDHLLKHKASLKCTGFNVASCSLSCHNVKNLELKSKRGFRKQKLLPYEQHTTE